MPLSPGGYPGIAAAEEAFYQLDLRANATAWSMAALMEHIDGILYAWYESVAPGMHQRPGPRIERPMRWDGP